MLVLNKDNVGQYVDGNGYYGSQNSWLTKDAFVTLWQTSVSIEEFIERCMLINKLLLEKYGTHQYTGGVKCKSGKFQQNGVKLVTKREQIDTAKKG